MEKEERERRRKTLAGWLSLGMDPRPPPALRTRAFSEARSTTRCRLTSNETRTATSFRDSGTAIPREGEKQWQRTEMRVGNETIHPSQVSYSRPRTLASRAAQLLQAADVSGANVALRTIAWFGLVDSSSVHLSPNEDLGPAVSMEPTTFGAKGQKQQFPSLYAEDGPFTICSSSSRAGSSTSQSHCYCYCCIHTSAATVILAIFSANHMQPPTCTPLPPNTPPSASRCLPFESPELVDQVIKAASNHNEWTAVGMAAGQSEELASTPANLVSCQPQAVA